MTKLPAVPVVVLLPLLLTTVACAARDDAGGGADGGPPAYPADAVVLRVDQVGGFVTPTMMLTRLPTVSVYGDGRVITEGPQIEIYPGPALPNVQVATIGADQVADLVDRARAAGVGSAADLGSPNVTDLPTTRFQLSGATGVEETEVEALLAGPEAETELTAAQRQARQRLRIFAESLTTPPTAEDAPPAGSPTVEGTPPVTPPTVEGAPPVTPPTVGDAPPATPPTVGGAEPVETTAYQATGLAVVAQPWVEPEGIAAPQVLAWPGPGLPGQEIGPSGDLGCVTVTGAALEQVRQAAAGANAATGWISDGRRWTLTFRPLLPDETDCASLTAAR
ncbi:hypothetical protein [Micromonospora yangpuensis]|uniref:Uncharacterized protein n=1 Tax=Micromonospora yangpuensis TaxID=683228 RepID=A0A1C6URW5_9ACTN|nr:hypothetical protein [Micromonospora yangpuensis]GGM06541.1 hypothetical protein GCM10012279_25550 [Micromonospora yangpuensis]SCL56807.1 hypothetical protein GA0070617_3348 [Micromonospora yangpuensis]